MMDVYPKAYDKLETIGEKLGALVKSKVRIGTIIVGVVAILAFGIPAFFRAFLKGAKK